MPILAPSVPDHAVPLNEASDVLAEFVEWVFELFSMIKDEGHRLGFPPGIFVATPSLISYLEPALEEARSDGTFDRVKKVVAALTDAHLVDHGLYGAQLQWKLANVGHWYDRFTTGPTRRVFQKLLDAIDALLESILDGVPGGGAIIEIKEAIGLSAEISDGN